MLKRSDYVESMRVSPALLAPALEGPVAVSDWSIGKAGRLDFDSIIFEIEAK